MGMSPGTRDSQSVLGELSYVFHKRPETSNDVSTGAGQQYVFPAIAGVQRSDARRKMSSVWPSKSRSTPT